MLECRGLTKNFGEKQALVDVDLEVRPGEIVALLGKNGAGKTTIMNCIAGITTPTRGELRFDGHDLLPESSQRARFGILIAAVFFDYLDVQDNLRLLMQASGYRGRAEIDARIGQILEMVGLAEQRLKKVRTFSFGMKQRLGLAQALIGDVDFLMLDEPLVGLDPPGRELFKQVLVEQAAAGKAVLFSSHDLADVADVSDRIVMIRSGSVIFSGPYRRERRVVIHTRTAPRPPVDVPGVGLSRHGFSLTDARQLNALIEAGVFTDNPVEDIQVYENDLMRLFEE